MSLSKVQREWVHGRWCGHCAYCGRTLPKRWHADHLESVGRITRYDRDRRKFLPTGELVNPQHDHLANMYPACVQCNLNKSSLSLSEWRVYLERYLDGLKSTHSTYRVCLVFGLAVEMPKPVTFYFERVPERRRIMPGAL